MHFTFGDYEPVDIVELPVPPSPVIKILPPWGQFSRKPWEDMAAQRIPLLSQQNEPDRLRIELIYEFRAAVLPVIRFIAVPRRMVDVVGRVPRVLLTAHEKKRQRKRDKNSQVVVRRRK